MVISCPKAFFPFPLSCAVPAIHGAKIGHLHEDSIWIAVNQSRYYHVFFFFKWIGMAGIRKFNFLVGWDRLDSNRILRILKINQTEIIRNNNGGIFLENTA